MMQNALAPPPPPPEMSQSLPPQGGNALAPAGGAPDMQQGQAPQGNGLAPKMLGQDLAQATPPQMPAPSHRQVVAALRHFDAIEAAIVKLLKNEDCGRANLKSDIIDAATKLVRDGMVTASNAAVMLAEVPQRPFDQKRWLGEQYLQTLVAAHNVVEHHRTAYAGQEIESGDVSPDDHINVMSGLNAHYAGLKGPGKNG